MMRHLVRDKAVETALKVMVDALTIAEYAVHKHTESARQSVVRKIHAENVKEARAARTEIS